MTQRGSRCGNGCRNGRAEGADVIEGEWLADGEGVAGEVSAKVFTAKSAKSAKMVI